MLSNLLRLTFVARSVRRYTKFLIVGTSNAVADLVVLNALMLLRPATDAWSLFWYNTVAVLCAILNSYFWNRRWTFADASDGSVREKVSFIVNAVLNIALNDCIVVWLSTYLVFSKSIPILISSNLSKALAMFLSSSLSYVFMRLFVFSPKAKSPEN